MSKQRIHILGGGVAGLATAMRLGEGGRHSPVIFERDDRPGGLARSLHFKGVSTDLGPHRIHTELPEVEKLVSEICAPSLYTVKRKSRIFLNGQFLDYPPAPVEVALRLGPLRMAQFGLSLLGESLRPARRPETYESLMKRAFGPALYAFMLRPYTEKVWKTDPSQIHADTARVRVSAGSLAKMIRGFITGEKKGSETSLREFRYVKGGVETLVRHLTEKARAAGAEILVNQTVRRLELAPDPAAGEGRHRVTAVETTAPGGATARHATEGVISTVPLNMLLGKVLPELPELADARRAAEGLIYLKNLLVLVIVRRKVISGDNWLYFPGPEWIFNRAYESKSFDPAMGPEDKSVLCVEITARPGDALDAMSDADLSRETVAQLARTGLFRADEVEETLVHRLEFGYPLYSLDYAERLGAVFAGLAKITNLISSGRQGLFNHNNTDHSILMGLRAAETLLADDPSPPAARWYARAEEFKHFRIVD